MSVFDVSWERDDDAIKEHFKWSSNCEYMKMVAAPPPRQTSAASFGGFGVGSRKKVFQTWRDLRNDVM